MPTPREAHTNTVERQGFSGARLQPADFGGEIIGRAVAGFGQDLKETANNLLKMQEEDARTAAQEADNTRTAERAQVLAEYQTLQGKAAVDAATELPKRLREIDERVAKDVLKSNGWARRMYDDVTAKRNADDIAPIYKHAATQRKVWQKGVREEAFNSAVGNAVQHYDDPTIVNESIATAGNHSVANVMADGIFEGPQLDAARRSGQGKAIAEVAQRIELDKGAQAAQDFIKAREGSMDPVDYSDLLTKLAPRAEDEESDSLIDGHLVFEGQTQPDHYYPGSGPDALAPKPETPEAEIPDTREVPLDITAGYGISSDIGPRAAPLKPDGTRGSTDHAGLDLKYPMGTPVRAMLSGTASVRNQGNGGYGQYIDLGHGNGLDTRYAHLSRVVVKPGQPVKKGDIIGYSGNSGGVAAHLHFEARQNGAPIDPRSLNGRELTVGGHRLAQAQAARSVAPVNGPKALDLEATIASIKAAGYNPRFEAKMLTKARQRYAEVRQVKAANEEGVKEQVASFLNTLDNPENFTSVEQLPLSVRRQLGDHPELEQGYRRWAQNNVDAAESRARARAGEARAVASEARQQAETQADLDFATMIYGNPDAFKRIDLTDPRQTGNLSTADRMKYMGIQTALAKSDEGSTKTANYDAIRTTVRRFAGEKPPKNIGKAFEEAARREEQWIARNPGKPVPDAVREGIAREVMTTYVVATPGMIFGETRKPVRGYELADTKRPKGSRVEVDSFEAVKAQLQQIWGRTPSDAEVNTEIGKRSGAGKLRL